MNANKFRLQKLKEMEMQNPSDPFLKFAMAQEYIALQQTKEAEELLVYLAEKHPDYVPTYYHLGKLREESGLYDEAIALYRSGIVAAEQAGDKHAANELKAALFAIEE